MGKSSCISKEVMEYFNTPERLRGAREMNKRKSPTTKEVAKKINEFINKLEDECLMEGKYELGIKHIGGNKYFLTATISLFSEEIEINDI